MQNSRVRSIRVALAVFLVKMRLGVSNRVLGSIFRLKNKRAVSRIVHEVAEALSKDFVPYNLGFQHIERDTVLRYYQTSVASQLMADHDDQLITVMDSTYLYLQKSSNNKFQHRSFSMHKHRNLIKPMIITATVYVLLLLSAKYLNLRKLFNTIHLQLPLYILYRMDTFWAYWFLFWPIVKTQMHQLPKTSLLTMSRMYWTRFMMMMMSSLLIEGLETLSVH